MRVSQVSVHWLSYFCIVVLVYSTTGAPDPDCPPEQVCSGTRRAQPPPTDNRCGPEQVCSNQGETIDPEPSETKDPDPIDEYVNNEGSEGGNSERSWDIKKKPNIVFILLDDVGWADVGWHNKKMHTPHMNQLAKEGVTLTNHYSLPVCTPSRASFLTGYHASKLGLQRTVLGLLEPYGIPTKFTLLPEVLKKYNYATHALGKWHVGYCDRAYTPMARGFDTFFGFYNGAENNYDHCNKDDIYFAQPECKYFDFRDGWAKGRRYQGQFSGHLYNNRAVYIINKHDTRKPLFMYLAISHTHFPLQAPPEYCRNCDAYAAPELKPRHEMCCAMAAADSIVANVTDALKRKRMYDNTVIVVVSDNGGSVNFGGNNYPYKGNKESLWEGGSKTPAFVHSPLLKKKGYKNNKLFHITDWYPTFVRLAGGKPDEAMDGYDQWDVINANKKTQRHEMLYNIDNQTGTWFVAFRVGDWKLIMAPPASQVPNIAVPDNETTDRSFDVEYLRNYTNPPPFPADSVRTFMYNLKDDPYEDYNLAGSTNLTLRQKEEDLKKFNLRYYVETMKPAVKMAADPAGSPEKDGGWYWVGWCRRYVDVPDRKGYSDLLIGYPH